MREHGQRESSPTGSDTFTADPSSRSYGSRRKGASSRKKRAPQEIVFDAESRRDYLTGFHKRKVARQKQGEQQKKMLALQARVLAKKMDRERRERRDAFEKERMQLMKNDNDDEDPVDVSETDAVSTTASRETFKHQDLVVTAIVSDMDVQQKTPSTRPLVAAHPPVNNVSSNSGTIDFIRSAKSKKNRYASKKSRQKKPSDRRGHPLRQGSSRQNPQRKHTSRRK